MKHALIGRDQTSQRLEALQTNSHTHQWSSETDIDWEQKLVRPHWLLKRFHAALISQFMYGERATIRVCNALSDRIEDNLIKDLLARQIADEQRHAVVYERYLERLGDIAPEDPALAGTVEQILQWRGSHLGLVTAVHILLEGEALRTLQDLANEYPCPLFSQINTKISQDEARHVAFGKIYLKKHLADLELSERMAIYQFVKTVWEDTTSGLLSGYSIPGFVSRHLRNRWVREGWVLHCRSLIDIGLLKVDEIAKA